MPKGNSKQETRQRILEAALVSFARSGFEKTSVKSIAKAANVGHGTVFLHFFDKAQLYAEVLQLAGDRFLSHVSECSATTYGTLAQALDGWIYQLARRDDASMLLGRGDRTDPRSAVSAAAQSVDTSFIHFWRSLLESWFDESPAGSERLGELARLIVFTASGFVAIGLAGNAVPKSSVLIEDFARAIEAMAIRR